MARLFRVSTDTSQIWGLGILTMLLALGLGDLGVLPFQVTSGFYSGILLITGGLTVLYELVIGRKKRRLAPDDAIEAIALGITIVSGLLGLYVMGFEAVPAAIVGGAGIIKLLLAGAVSYSLFK